MVQAMAQTPQPHFLSSWVSSFGAFDLAHGWAVNLFVVVALAVLGIAFLAGRTRMLPSQSSSAACSAWPTGYSSRTSASSAASAPTPTA